MPPGVSADGALPIAEGVLAVVSTPLSVLKFVPLCSECVLGDHEIDAVLYAGCKYEDFETRRDAVYGLLGRYSTFILCSVLRRLIC